jgi:hypothetical protein
MWFFLFFGLVRFAFISYLSSPRCRLSSDRRHHAVVPYHTYFPLSQDELAVSVSSSSNTSSRRLPSRAKTKVLNPYHHHNLPFPDRLSTSTTAIKKIISTLITIRTAQPRLHFGFNNRHRSLSPLSHGHRLSTQRHTR